MMFARLSFFIATAVLPALAAAGPLHDACRRGDVSGVQQRLQAGDDVNDRDDRRETPLFAATLADQLSVAVVLIEAGADINARNDLGFTALHAAAYAGSTGIARMLLD